MILPSKKFQSVPYLYLKMKNNTGNMNGKNQKNRTLPMSFIVRIYRFIEDGPQGMVGVVETVANSEEKQFTGIKELGDILAGAHERYQK